MNSTRPKNAGSALRDPRIREQVEALLGRMNLAQKIGQMTQAERQSISPEEARSFHVGSVMSGAGSNPAENSTQDWVSLNDAYWAGSAVADAEHLGIPLIFGVDAIHGHNNVTGATIFPHNIGLGAANDPELLERIAQVTAREVLATGVDWTFAPTIAVARDPHWGRTYESYSEDPEIVSAYSGRFVQGLQGNLGEDSVVACLKHWVGDGGTDEGIDQGDTTVSRDELERIHIAPYYTALQAGALTVMVSFSSWKGEKCHGQKYLITELLKDELQFTGFVISDWDGVDYLADNYFDAIALGVNAGSDMFMVSQHWRQFIKHLTRHVEQGTVPLQRIDDAVRRILSVKLAFGLFDKPRPEARQWSNHASFGSAEHREIAREAARKSLVLLKNQDNLLPLGRNRSILVAGKSAHDKGNQCGGFTVTWQGLSGNDLVAGGSSIWEGIKAVAPNAVLSADYTGSEANPQLHEFAIVVIGETPYAEGQGDIRSGDDSVIEPGSQMSGALGLLHAYGGSMELAQLHPEDLQAITNISARGIPVIAVLISGRPLVINQELDLSTAFVAAWLPGSEGQAIADVLFGDHNFSGKLAFSWPANEHQLHHRGDEDYDPLFPYGHGLAY